MGGFGLRTGDGDGHIVERHRDGRVRLVHGDFDAGDGFDVKNAIGDALGERFDQVDVFTFDDGHDVFGDTAVVNGVAQGIALAGFGEVEEQRDVHDEGLGAFLLEVEHAVCAAGTHAGEDDLIHAIPYLSCRV